MTKQALTDMAIKKFLPPRQGQFELWDTRTPGFGIRVSHAGAKAFVLVYRFNARPRRLTLGRYPALSLADARSIAQEALRTVALGSDPAVEKMRTRHSQAIESFDGFVTYFIEAYARPKNRSADETERLLRREFVTTWGNRHIAEISRQDIAAVLDRIMRDGRHTMANRSLAAIRKLFNWAVERGIIEQSPCTSIRKPANEVSRDRVLDDDELVAVWRAAERTPYPFGHIVRLLILTGQRRSEVTSMRWVDIDVKHSTWSIPAELTKAGRQHVVPMTKIVEQLLVSIPRFESDFVFPARGRTHRSFSGFGKCKERLDELSGISDWTLHDLRRTVATNMARLSVAPHIVERVLNHTTGTLGGVAGVYNRFGYLPEMRSALVLWEQHLGRLTESTKVETALSSQVTDIERDHMR
jgi:integrase